MRKTLREKCYIAWKQLKRIFIYPELRREGSDYDAYWKSKRGNDVEALSDWQQERSDIILNHIPQNTALTIVDIGGGAGAVLNYIAKKRNVEKGIVDDISGEALAHAKEFGFIARTTDITKQEELNGIEKADHYILFEILEHIPKPENVLDVLYAKTERALFFSVPNTGYITHRLRLLFGKFPLQWWLEPGEHLRYWTRTDMKWWLDSLGYKGKYELKTYKGVPLLDKLWPSLFAAGLVVILKK